ncbi:hypothetical protein M8J75_005767 [Diaphorina citri]|nr:hypothetical protein M8J75_005767 [Diaphorina citri]
MSDPNVGTSMELAQEDPGGPLRKPPETTTLSTIAVRSGSTRIVIALLQSRNSYHKTQTTRPTQFSSKANTLCKANTVGESPLAPRKTSGQLKFLSILKCCLSWKYLECRRSQLKQIHDNKSIPFL